LSAYRFCRTDDIALLVDALNRCWAPYFPDEPLMTPAAFKRSIRDLQVWCSSCMVAFSGAEPIGVLIGAKRASATLIHKIAVHPDHRRQGHGRHLLDSLGSKLAILGPPRIVAEVPETIDTACALFSACGYVEESRLMDYVLERPALTLRQAQGHPERGRGMSERGDAARVEGFVIPVTIDDLAANGLLAEGHPRVCWERSVETLTARKDEIAGLAVASDERIEAYLLYRPGGFAPPDPPSPSLASLDSLGTPRASRGAGAPLPRSAPAGRAGGAPAVKCEIVSLRSFIDDGGARLKQLLTRLCARGMDTFWLAKVHPAEISKESLETLGFSPAGGHLLYASTARPQ
jgi:GNAT superfamily N-acetyltransferase